MGYGLIGGVGLYLLIGPDPGRNLWLNLTSALLALLLANVRGVCRGHGPWAWGLQGLAMHLAAITVGRVLIMVLGDPTLVVDVPD